MVVRNSDELQYELNRRVAIATESMRDKVYEIVDAYIKKFYVEWTPSMYQRMHQLINSLIKTEVRAYNGGYEARVYLDFTKMNHDIAFINGRFVRHKHWPEETIGEVAASGSLSHGGYKHGTKIWVDPMREIEKNQTQMLRNALIKAGVPIM